MDSTSDGALAGYTRLTNATLAPQEPGNLATSRSCDSRRAMNICSLSKFPTCFSASSNTALPAAGGTHKVQLSRRSRGGVVSWRAGSR